MKNWPIQLSKLLCKTNARHERTIKMLQEETWPCTLLQLEALYTQIEGRKNDTTNN